MAIHRHLRPLLDALHRLWQNRKKRENTPSLGRSAMNIPGLVTVNENQPELLDKLARMVGTSFLEELWYATWLEALDDSGRDTDRKRTILQALIRADFEATAPYGCCLALDDCAGAVNAFLRSELSDAQWTHIDKLVEEASAKILTPKEQRVLFPQAEAMGPLSDTNWMYNYAAPEDDFIYFISIGVDPNRRGTGAFGRLVKPILAFADTKKIDCYLDCYTDRLEQIYTHYGFEVVEVKQASGFAITERCMIRRSH